MSTQGIDMLLNSGSSSTSGVSSRNATDGMPPELLNVNAVSVSERMQQLILQCQNTGGNPTTADFKDLAAALQSLTNDVERYAEAKGKAEAARAAEKKKLQRPEKILPEASRNKLIQIKKAIQEAPVCHCLSVRDMKHARVQPDRRWFGNTRVVGQKELSNFREEIAAKAHDPYTVLLKRKQLPMGLLTVRHPLQPAPPRPADAFFIAGVGHRQDEATAP